MSFKTSALFCLLLTLLTACSADPGCRIQGSCTDESYRGVRLQNLDGSEISSTAVSGTEFSFLIDEDIRDAYMAELLFFNTADSTDYVVVPVGIENGTVTISYGASFKISGTPLNKKVYAFLSGMSRLRDEVTSPQRTVAVSEIPNEFSHFYCRSITLNYDNPLGAYIFDRYGSRLLGEDRTMAEQSLKR